MSQIASLVIRKITDEEFQEVTKAYPCQPPTVSDTFVKVNVRPGKFLVKIVSLR